MGSGADMKNLDEKILVGIGRLGILHDFVKAIHEHCERWAPYDVDPAARLESYAPVLEGAFRLASDSAGNICDPEFDFEAALDALKVGACRQRRADLLNGDARIMVVRDAYVRGFNRRVYLSNGITAIVGMGILSAGIAVSAGTSQAEDIGPAFPILVATITAVVAACAVFLPQRRIARFVHKQVMASVAEKRMDVEETGVANAITEVVANYEKRSFPRVFREYGEGLARRMTYEGSPKAAQQRLREFQVMVRDHRIAAQASPG